MTISIAVAGASGYAGAEVLRLLLDHPAYRRGQLVIGALAAGSHAGHPVIESLPHLPELAGRTFTETNPDVLAGHDVIIFALPHGHSAALAPFFDDSTLLIDCAADFRLENKEDWDHWYGGSYSGNWPYGLPELPGQREILQGARRIAGTGCFPTAATLALFPGVQSGLLGDELSIVSFTGTSGAGKSLKVSMLASEVMGSATAYGVGGIHRHTPEIKQNLQPLSSKELSVSFTPVLAPMTRGILTVASAHTRATQEEIREVYSTAYQNEPFVSILPTGVQPSTKYVLGSNAVQLGIAVDERAHRVIITAVIDNLTKGTAGGVIQCMNLALGWKETAGLNTSGLAP